MQMDLGGPMNAHETETTTRPGLGRRTVLKGAAWSVPAVVAVGATPAFAQTGGTEVPLIVTEPTITANRPTTGNQRTVNFTNWLITSNETVTVASILFAVQGFTVSTYSNPGTLTAGVQTEITFSGTNGNASTTTVGAITITITLLDGREAVFTTTGTDVPASDTVNYDVSVAPSVVPTITI